MRHRHRRATLGALLLATTAGAVLLPTAARADTCGSHHDDRQIIDCYSAAVGDSCNVAGTTVGTSGDLEGTCQLLATEAGAAHQDAGEGALTCVASPEQGSMLPHGVLAFLAPWLLALLFPILVRKDARKRPEA
jgi:hypothetical protein